ncbi:MAG: metal ABC transporter ATP-binding protein [Thermodesulfobacteriota bacterium]
MNTPVIQIQDLWFSYGGHSILKAVNLEIGDREFLALIGPNGGGKTTLLKLMLGLLKPDQGKIRIFGTTPEAAARRIGYVPQNVHINSRFPISVKDVVLMGRLNFDKGRSRPNDQDRRETGKIMEQLGVWELRDRRIRNLSVGQLQRVFIARALAAGPEMLFLDEPAASVDAQGQNELYDLLKKLNERLSIVLVTHDLIFLSSHIKSIACVNEKLFYHNEPEMTPEMLDVCQCPVDLIAHGVPHRVLRAHKDETND